MEDIAPTDLGRGRTIGKLDVAVSRPNESRNVFLQIRPSRDSTARSQHLLVFQAIVKSNGWSSDTAALQLVTHLDGEALQVALLVLSRNKEGWREIADELSAYYNTPGRLAVFRRRFENGHRHPGSDSATFATELGALALHGFFDMTEKGRDLMVRDKFIASQRSCDLRRHLDGAAPGTSIKDIADSCRVWESYGEPADIEDRSQIVPIPARTITKPKSGVGSLGPAKIGLPRRTDHNIADRELLIRTVLEVVRECRKTDMNDEDRGQCFSCGFLGHGVNRCTWLDRSFPYITPGWSVNLRNGEYRTSKRTGEVHIPNRGKEGWFGREGQPPGPSVVMSTGGEEVRKLSTGTPLSAEAVEFSPAPAIEQHRQAGRRNMAVGTSGNKPTQVEELSLSKAGGGGGVRFTSMAEVHRPPSTEDEGEILAQRSGQQVIGNAYSGRNPVMSSAPGGGTLLDGQWAFNDIRRSQWYSFIVKM